MNDPVHIIHADEAFVVVAKTTGVPSQPDPSGDPSALTLAQEQTGTTLYPVHRIDRPASGLLLFACTPASADTLSEMLQRREIRRRYWAVVSGTVATETGSLEDHVLHDRRKNKSYVNPRGKPATLHYEVRSRGDRYTLLEVELETGRHHQIRAQLAHKGWPIRGDLKYGARRSLPGGGIMLHAVRLELPHPHTRAPLTFSAEPPEDPLWTALTSHLCKR